jgi:hypothetical protein
MPGATAKKRKDSTTASTAWAMVPLCERVAQARHNMQA